MWVSYVAEARIPYVIYFFSNYDDLKAEPNLLDPFAWLFSKTISLSSSNVFCCLSMSPFEIYPSIWKDNFKFPSPLLYMG